MSVCDVIAQWLCVKCGKGEKEKSKNEKRRKRKMHVPTIFLGPVAIDERLHPRAIPYTAKMLH